MWSSRGSLIATAYRKTGFDAVSELFRGGHGGAAPLTGAGPPGPAANADEGVAAGEGAGPIFCASSLSAPYCWAALSGDAAALADSSDLLYFGSLR